MRRSTLALVTVVAACAVTGTATGWAADPPPTCDGKGATIVGTSGDDSIAGTNGPDVIVGLGGNDSIGARGGADVVCAGEGDDSVSGPSGANRVFGEDGADYLYGDGAYFGGVGADRLNAIGDGGHADGGEGDDVVLDSYLPPGSTGPAQPGQGRQQLLGGLDDDVVSSLNRSDGLHGGGE